MKEKRYQGFTLIELLAVIVILAVIALIATPLIMNVINDAKKSAARDAGYSVIKAGELAAATSGIESVNPPYHYDQNSNLPMKGTKPTKFTLDINEEMHTQLRAWINGYCVVKEYDKEEVTVDESKKTEADCVTGGGSGATPGDFETDSWDTIAKVVKDDPSAYPVGSEKEVTLTGPYAGTYTVRVANNTTPSECRESDFSQTSCGFVLEFVDIITKQQINTTSTNKGGWPASAMYDIVNTDIYNGLPSDLKKVIKDTKVVSSHGSGDTTNITSTDHLYLLATKEIWGKEGTTNEINNDSSDNQTRQLDYYKSKGVTTSNYSGAIKRYNGLADEWWMRSADSINSYDFYDVDAYGDWGSNYADITYGVAPAFRIG